MPAVSHNCALSRYLLQFFLDARGQSHPRLAAALLRLMPEQVATAFMPVGGERIALEQQARELAEAQAGDGFSDLQLEHGERLAAERAKIESYSRQQEAAMAGIAIENTRQAKQRELLERRRTDLASLDQRRALVPEPALVAIAHVA